MKHAALLTAASLLLATAVAAASASAQTSTQSTPPTTTAPPPPGINDPGVRQLPPPKAKLAPSATSSHNLPAMQDGSATSDAKHMDLPDVSSHQDGEDEVQEYRRSGLLYMVVVTPKSGIPQTYDVDPDGTRHMQTGEPPVRPVMYKVLEWGKSRPAEASSSSDGS